ncbi:hypothetical protein CC1G_11807 [Coprinopsis cinerea okayama7|uniref:Uncharacterized protein n=1 Tax=Coprinopsis cinerea (strain Okayama-7 / 130 / ATCC MYA-4618 / FGSC 9003) TaxID=240176 RepID=A8N814_COPC7|nr:hypothetical protein CC1G_11807 [Coprinopsis cinerea okayama7\|eukprot:XP_001830970.1 hypothetical protein CC1G_11807 [Coprinopsis cinerea okayama7\
MVSYSSEPHHDVVNLHRLLRRLEKSVQDDREWDLGADRGVGSSKVQIRLKAQKDLQKVKYARKLVQNVDSYDLDVEDPYGTERNRRIHELNDVKIRLDRVEEFLKDQVQKHTERPQRPPSILARLPKPEPIPVPVEEPAVQPQTDEEPVASTSSQPAAPEVKQPADNLLLSPSDLDNLPSAGLGDIISPPPYEPTFSGARSTATSSALPIHASGSFTNRKAFQAQGHTSLQEELSSQLESMAAQLKRNAIHFSSNLEKDKAVIEMAGEKLEQNYDVMQKEKGRLALLNKTTGSTTWLTIGIILVVLLLFIVMVGLIRFSRF